MGNEHPANMALALEEVLTILNLRVQSITTDGSIDKVYYKL
jgi:hypothetical protein